MNTGHHRKAVTHAEFVWRTVSEALDSVPPVERELFLTRLVLLAALDHLSGEELTGLIAAAAPQPPAAA